MSRTVRRYCVSLDGLTDVRLTGDPLAVAARDDSAVVEFWAEHDTGAPETVRTFIIVGTGQPIPDSAVYVGTAPRTRYGLVWHLFELTEGGRP